MTSGECTVVANGLLDVFPVFQPLIVKGQVRPGAVHGPLQRGPLVRIQLTPFLDGQGHIVDLLDGNQPRNRRRDRRVAEDAADRQPREFAIFFRVGLSGLLSPLKSELLANGLMPNQPTSCFFIDAHSPLSSSTTLVLAVYGVQMASNCWG